MGTASIFALRGDSADEAILDQVENLFFATASRGEFANDEERLKFRRRWLGVYLQEWPDICFAAVDSRRRVSGYVVGCFDTHHLRKAVDHASDLDCFEGQWEAYPAHFHVNVDEQERGTGIGTELVAAFCRACRSGGVPGVHVITALGSRNISFYNRCGFGELASAENDGRRLLFLGKPLGTN